MSSCVEQSVLKCCKCGEKIILLGPKEDWRSRRAVFRCECGQKLSPEGRAEEDVLAAS